MMKPGDWACVACGDHQFERNLACRKCGAPKPQLSTNKQMAKPGDWICPNPACRDVQFEKNVACRKCGTPKPAFGAGGGAPRAAAAHPQQMFVIQSPIPGMGGKGGLLLAAPQQFGGKGGMQLLSSPFGQQVMLAAPGGGQHMAPGDWRCAQCGDHQFAKNVVCRKCQAPKPQVGANNQVLKPGDWLCPNPECGDVQFAKNAACRKCGTERPESAGPVPTPHVVPGITGAALPFGIKKEVDGDKVHPEDWNCPECGDLQFGRNVACRKCGNPKPKVSTNNQVSKKGDWICPNRSCGDVQFEKNWVCRRCGTPKPLEVARKQVAASAADPAAAAADQKPMAEGDWLCTVCGDHQFAKNLMCRKCGGPKPQVSKNGQVAKKGDWICPNPGCGDVQFERNAACRRCGMAKPLVPGGVSPMLGGFGGAFAGGAFAGAALAQSLGLPPGTVVLQMPTAAPGGRGVLRPGDWVCPNPACQDVQFEKNTACRKCGSAKPLVATNRQVFKAGDWICPNPECKDVQFEKNVICRKCGTAKPEGVRGRSRSPRAHA